MSKSIQTAFKHPSAGRGGRLPGARAFAKAAGESTYTTGVPCLHGHLGERFTSTGQCCACLRVVRPGLRLQARKDYGVRLCAQCGRDVLYSQRGNTFCSRACANAWGYRARGGLSCEKLCKECDKPFTAAMAGLYCSAECKLIAKNRLNGVPKLHFARLLRLAHRRNHGLTVDIMLEMLAAQGGKCALTGRKMTFVSGAGNVATNASIDRIDSNLGYTADNVQLTCVAANKMKRDYPQDFFVDWCRSVAEHLATSGSFVYGIVDDPASYAGQPNAFSQ